MSIAKTSNMQKGRWIHWYGGAGHHFPLEMVIHCCVVCQNPLSGRDLANEYRYFSFELEMRPPSVFSGSLVIFPNSSLQFWCTSVSASLQWCSAYLPFFEGRTDPVIQSCRRVLL